MRVGEGDEMTITGQRVENGGENLILRSPWHRSPGKAADDTIGARAVEACGEPLGGVEHDGAVRESPSKDGGVGRVDLDGEKATPPSDALEQQLGEGTRPRAKLHQRRVMSNMTTVGNHPRQRPGAWPDRADRERFTHELAEKSEW